MKRNFYVPNIVLLIISLSSCKSIYLPNVPATPMFTKSGEIYVAGHSNIKGNLSGNLAVAVSDHIAIHGNGSFIKNHRGNEQIEQYLYEGGLGYFTTFGKKKDRILEFYGGYGVGNSFNADTRATTTGMSPVETREMDFQKLYFQGNYSTRKEQVKIFGIKRQLSYGTAIRASFVKMKSFQIDDVAQSTMEENLFVEPLFFTRMELKNGFQLQYTNGFNIGVVKNTYLKPGNAVFTLGLIYKLSKK